MKKLKQLVIIYLGCVKTILVLWLMVSSSMAEAVAFIEGTHYEKLDAEVTNNQIVKDYLQVNAKPGKVQVLEFFSYGCYWCGQVHQPISVWAAKNLNKATVVQYPVIFNKVWRELGKLYYVANDSSAKNHVIDDAIFEAIHIKGMRAWQPSVMQDILLTSANISTATFNEKYNSEVIEKKLDLAHKLTYAFKIDSTPCVIVSGKKGSYYTNLVKTTNQQTLLQVIDHLVEMQQKP